MYFWQNPNPPAPKTTSLSLGILTVGITLIIQLHLPLLLNDCLFLFGKAAD